MLLFNFLFIKNKGKNNNINIEKGLNVKCSIKGNNNTVKILRGDSKNKKKVNINIKIHGDNNTIVINGINMIKKLYIGVGSSSACNNIDIEIGKNFTCVDSTILAYNSNVPIKIGDDCLFSKNIVIRSGEVPHQIIDLTTGKSLDNSDGIYIGNHVWIGENTYIMKKVKLGNNTIVGNASVVTRKFNEENVVIAGNPAEIRRRNVAWK